MRKLLLAALLLAAPGIAWAQGMPPAYGPGVAGGGCSIATTSALGCIKPDGSTITVNGSGVASAIGGSATSVVVGTTTVGGGTTAYLLYNNAGTLGNEAVSSLSIALSQITGLGTGVATSLADNVGSAGAVVVNGGALGTPSSGTLTNATGLPIGGITGLGTGVGTALAASVTGSGGIVLGTSPSIASPTITGAFTATGLVTNGDLANASTTVNGQTCTLGGSCTITASAGSITPGTTTISGATAPCVIQNSTGTTMTCGPVSTALGTIPYRTVTSSPTIAAGDMGGIVYSDVSGGGTLTVPAISSTVLASGMSVQVTNYSASTETVSTTPTINAGGGCVSGTGIPAGDSWFITSNGTTLDCVQTVSSASGSTSLAVGSTPVTGGTTAYLLYNNAGTLGNEAVSALSIALSQITGLGTGVATALGNAVNSTGGLVTSAQTYTAAIPITWDSNTTVANGTVPVMLPPWAGGGTISSVSYYTNGTGTPSFSIAVQIGGTNVTGCNGLTVSSASPTTTSCTAANTFTSSSSVQLVVSGTTGSPNQAIVQINVTHTAN